MSNVRFSQPPVNECHDYEPLAPPSPPESSVNTLSYPLLPSHVREQRESRPRSWSGQSESQQPVNHEPKLRDDGEYDPERGPPPMHHRNETVDSGFSSGRRSSSWDWLGGIRRLEHSVNDFDTRRASQAHLAFAEGDVPKNTFFKFYNYLLNVSAITRWTIYIIPVLGLIWIPGILSFTAYPDATIWGVRLLWWSVWLSVVWCSWWGSRVFSMVLPHIARFTVGVVAVGTHRYIEWLDPLQRYVTLFSWTLIVWITFQPLINTRREADISTDSKTALSTAAKILFAFFECAIILLAEKVAIQYIATRFHERSYAERVAEHKFAMRVLANLYRHSRDMPWRLDTLQGNPADAAHAKKPRRLLKKALQGVRFAATTTTTALGNVASEIAGSSVLQPNSPQAVVRTVLESANKSRMLARRLFYSFAKPGSKAMTVDDIEPFFPTQEDADAAFALLDKDMNGDATKEEIEIACMDCHRELLSIEHSMRDLDSAVGRLDNILMIVYLFAVILIIAVALEAQLLTLATTAGTFILSLSWLLSASLGEVLISIIFLFVKHPYDVGDRVKIDTEEYTVKEIRLLSTVFLNSSSCATQAPHAILNTKFILNRRRSPQMSEEFQFDVAFDTSFDKIERLRELMLAFVKAESRDFLPSFDVIIIDIPEQEKMTLSADIRYKSNWQHGALKATRRNKWITALKTAMAKAKIWGPKGDPDPPPAVDRVTLVPWEKIAEEDEKTEKEKKGQQRKEKRDSVTVQDMQAPAADWNMTDKQAIIMDDTENIFDDAGSATTPSTAVSSRSSSRERRRRQQMPVSTTMPTPSALSTSAGSSTAGEEIEMKLSPKGAPSTR
ncbi:uncharacterized protein LAESUDRAFT_60532 [Laetiporus sulphureus 93-53]|uniref:EF-hand domain-containing protein n=1 Tax=Laetiporus sulphureus 93-53 TaxID=1314785 RepID=A0A165F3F8_9APHY|nr:uncharacterized protein LAESUDRAFT_60532 [Laetiporus sulphureus 93-53]KZT08300.1 hypothetical protein LAESUDRAFT_60532 [Laetiporus sulphureus 93-53]